MKEVCAEILLSQFQVSVAIAAGLDPDVKAILRKNNLSESDVTTRRESVSENALRAAQCGASLNTGQISTLTPRGQQLVTQLGADVDTLSAALTGEGPDLRKQIIALCKRG